MLFDRNNFFLLGGGCGIPVLGLQEIFGKATKTDRSLGPLRAF